MKPNKLFLGVIACALGASMYAHQLHAENSLQVPNNGNSKDSQPHNLVFIDEHQKRVDRPPQLVPSNLYNSTNTFTQSEKGYAPIPYESILRAVNYGQIDYWVEKGIRAYQPSEKTEKFFTWKVKGTKLFGLDVIGIERGVCDISGNDRCGDARHTVIIFDASTDKTRKEIKDKTRIDYGNLTTDQKKSYPYLGSINFEGKEKSALYFLN
ncbi:hypothetical protein N1009_003111 [Acinetobacter baumannii]|uniref:hypothetical protein n=1 Tax=Acinetobacter baumannii TaxID=470 RepID=UPI0005801316|nr:hypothetical protein [Acinetobacter baumannii]EKU1422680.1 hypothetical protein [Acinetobacter baumannii]EKU3485991.1 hypothetical protein [Acinetobacter baumannii]EKU6395429.1 hypothetical protein [Acinetobacter baumannii]EKX1118181.1 hypothetical protein [Acinetobacter baumannii]EKX1186640.1 hypothetical protein [Acinetobacter baumannii]